MIDVFGLAIPMCANVNPHTQAAIRVSTGNFENADGSPNTQYQTVFVDIEVQAVSSADLKQIENINQQEDMRSVYLFGAAKALNRPLQIGGDILTFYGSDWLIAQQLEEWGNGEWSKVLVVRQLPSTS
ncbi:hypothetical protein [Acetobacter sp.]|uniref:hypothetical protein n=1 Tax=Acetobacter sp. TaxID=440 RepID=UPI0039EC93DA